MSLVLRKWAKFGEVTKLKHPIKIAGFDGKSSHVIKEKVGLSLDFVLVQRYVKFLVCDIQDNILGNDVLKDGMRDIALNTKTSMLTIGRKKIGAHPSSTASRIELCRRGAPTSSPEWWGTVWALTATDYTLLCPSVRPSNTLYFSTFSRCLTSAPIQMLK